MSKQIPLTRGKAAIVDDEDYEWLNQYNWCAQKRHAIWYAMRGRRQDGKYVMILMHREILKPPIGMETDHKDHDGLNNQRYNLRAATHAQNIHNQRKRTGLSSRFKGVHWYRRIAKWMAQIKVNNRPIHLGYFLSETEAAQAYDEAALRYFGEFAYTNKKRLPEHLQAALYNTMTTHGSDPERETAVDIKEWITKSMNLLSKSKWDLDDETLAPKAGACSKCPKRTGHQPMLWFDSEARAKAGDQCMDPVCYQGKQVARVARQARELQGKHPRLVLVAKEHMMDAEAIAIRDRVGSYLPNWEYTASSKNATDAVPAMVVDGSGAGKLTYVKLKPQSSSGGSSRRGMGIPTPLRERRMQLDAKRWAQVLIDLRAKVEAATVADMTWKDKIAGLMAAVGLYGNQPEGMADHDQRAKLNAALIIKQVEKRQTHALELLWESFKPTLDKELRWMGPVTQTPPEMRETANWIADLVGLDAGKMFDDVCTRKGFTEPKVWAGLDADGTPKVDEQKSPKKTKVIEEKEQAAPNQPLDEMPESWKRLIADIGKRKKGTKDKCDKLCGAALPRVPRP